MIAEAIAVYLEDNAIGTAATDIFVGELPLNKSDSVMVLYSISPPQPMTIPYYEQTIDIWTRYANTKTGFDKIKEIYDLFHRKHHYTMGLYHVYLSNALGTIDDMGRDAERRKLYKFSLRFIWRLASN